MSITTQQFEGETNNNIFCDIGTVSLHREDFARVKKVLQASGLTIEELCAYALASIAETHVSEDGKVTPL